VTGYSAKEREEAAIICSCAASDSVSDEANLNGEHRLVTTTYTVAEWRGSSERASCLAADAAVEVMLTASGPASQCFAEAEAMIRCGWAP
jgi:hypothetical protein